jgi:hypothetical protein
MYSTVRAPGRDLPRLSGFQTDRLYPQSRFFRVRPVRCPAVLLLALPVLLIEVTP